MHNRKEFVSVSQFGRHKGFYSDDDFEESLHNIDYTDFFDYPDDDEFPYDSAYPLLCGSCHHFALSLQKLLGYNPYIIEEKDDKSFHAFCQVYRKGVSYFIDARGITSSFDEFMCIARRFVGDEFIIRLVTADDIESWKQDSDYDEEAFAFSEAVIKEYKECYTL